MDKKFILRVEKTIQEIKRKLLLNEEIRKTNEFLKTLKELQIGVYRGVVLIKSFVFSGRRPRRPAFYTNNII